MSHFSAKISRSICQNSLVLGWWWTLFRHETARTRGDVGTSIRPFVHSFSYIKFFFHSFSEGYCTGYRVPGTGYCTVPGTVPGNTPSLLYISLPLLAKKLVLPTKILKMLSISRATVRHQLPPLRRLLSSFRKPTSVPARNPPVPAMVSEGTKDAYFGESWLPRCIGLRDYIEKDMCFLFQDD